MCVVCRRERGVCGPRSIAGCVYETAGGNDGSQPRRLPWHQPPHSLPSYGRCPGGCGHCQQVVHHWAPSSRLCSLQQSQVQLVGAADPVHHVTVRPPLMDSLLVPPVCLVSQQRFPGSPTLITHIQDNASLVKVSRKKFEAQIQQTLQALVNNTDCAMNSFYV